MIAESPFNLEGKNGLYAAVEQRMKEQGHCVIVISEGAEAGLIDSKEKFTKGSLRTDESGNTHFDDPGEALKKGLTDRMKELYNRSVNVKYIDATYIQRSVPANPSDTIMCAKLAQNAVHGAMAGYTAFTVGIVRNAVAWIPI